MLKRGKKEKLADENNHSKDLEQTISLEQTAYSTTMTRNLSYRQNSDYQRDTTTQDSQMLITPTCIDNNKVTAYTEETSENVTSGGEECEVYMWMTIVAILNTCFLMLLLGYTVYCIYSVEKQEANDTGERSMEIKIRPQKRIDGLLKFLNFSHPSQATTDKDDLYSHNNIQVPQKVEYDCQVHHSYKEMKTSTEKKQCSPKPALPCISLPLSPRSESEQSFQLCFNSESKIIPNRKTGVLLPSIPSTCPPHLHAEKSGPQGTLHSKEEEHEYDYIELPIMPKQNQAENCEKEICAKEEAS